MWFYIANSYFPKELPYEDLFGDFADVVKGLPESLSQKHIINFANLIQGFKKIKNKKYKHFTESIEARGELVR